MKNGYKLFLLSLACVYTVSLSAAEQESGKPGRPKSPINYECDEDFNKICRESFTHQAPESDNNDDNLPTYAQYAAAYGDPNFYDDEGLTPLALPSPAAPPACPPTSSIVKPKDSDSSSSSKHASKYFCTACPESAEYSSARAALMHAITQHFTRENYQLKCTLCGDLMVKSELYSHFKEEHYPTTERRSSLPASAVADQDRKEEAAAAPRVSRGTSNALYSPWLEQVIRKQGSTWPAYVTAACSNKLITIAKDAHDIDNTQQIFDMISQFDKEFATHHESHTYPVDKVKKFFNRYPRNISLTIYKLYAQGTLNNEDEIKAALAQMDIEMAHIIQALRYHHPDYDYSRAINIDRTSPIYSPSSASSSSSSWSTKSHRKESKIAAEERDSEDEEDTASKFRKSKKKYLRVSTICTICGKETKRLNEHLLSHGEPQYQCSECTEERTSHQNIVSHFVRQHMTKSFCKICAKKIEDKNPREHARLQHIDILNKRKKRDKKTNTNLSTARTAGSPTPEMSASSPEAEEAAAPQSAPKKARTSKD